MLQAINIEPEQVYLTNVVKCHTPNGRCESVDEFNACMGHLQKQIALIKPKLIVAVGRIAAHFLLNSNQALGRLRGRIYTYGNENTPLLVTYHPAYLLRSPRDKSKAWQDLLVIKQHLHLAPH